MSRSRLVQAISAIAVAAALTVARPAAADVLRPGYLELREIGSGLFEVRFKTPTLNGARLKISAVLPSNCESVTPVAAFEAQAALIERWTIRCQGPLAGQTIAIDGLRTVSTDVLVRIQPQEGGAITTRLRPVSTSFIVPEAPSAWNVAQTYLVFGVEHILGGIDHLLFVLALLLIVSGRWLLLKTITAFTVAHSLTLVLATLGLVKVPSAPVEAIIALSIVFLASELAHNRSGRPGLTARYPWVVSFTFGLLHGFGFAGALAEVGLPENQIPLALFQFNVGVEIGQVMFVGAVLALLWALRRLRIPQPAWAWRIPAYAVGSLAAFWTLERIVAFW